MDIQPGRYDNISLEQYHRECPGWSKSALDKVNRSMAHYLCAEDKQTPALAFGAAFHCAVLTPDLYEAQYCVAPICDRRKKEGKEDYAEFQQKSLGKTVLESSDCAAISKMKENVFSHPVAGALFNSGDAEHSFFWIDKKTGLLCKCRPDYLRNDGIVVDIKTTSNASYFEFQRDIAKYRYYVQGAFFLDGISAVLDKKHSEFLLVAVETTEPYAVAVYRLDDDALNVGRTAYHIDLDKVLAWEKQPEESRWSGYPDQVQDMYLPAWVN